MPLIAVAEHLKQHHPECVTVYVGERGGKFGGLADRDGLFDERYHVSAGKFRRYRGVAWWRKVLDIKTLLLNIRDMGRVVLGIIQAWRLLRRVQPDIVFLKGGFVGVPVGLAAALRRVPIVTHDSDAVPGLANRLVGRWAALHAVALTPELYPYAAAKTIQVGVLVESAYQPVTPAILRQYRQQLDIPAAATVLLVTGGSQGAVALNKAMQTMADTLLREFSDLMIVHQVGKGHQQVYGSYRHERLRVLEFLQPMYVYTGASDIVVTRAGANTIAELGVQGKAAVVVPSPYLAGGHQLKNAHTLKRQGSVAVVEQSALYDSQDGLLTVLRSLVTSSADRRSLAATLQEHTIADAVERVSELLIQIVQSSGGDEAA